MVYLDYASHTPISPHAKKALTKALTFDTANNQSAHRKGRIVQEHVEQNLSVIKKIVRARPGDVCVVSGSGTEANVQTLRAMTNDIQGGTFMMSAIEHDSIRVFAETLEKRGWRIVQIPVRSDGQIDVHTVEQLIQQYHPNVISCMLVNNEIGTTQPVSDIASFAKKLDPLIKVHCDAAQAPAILPISMQSLGVDAITLCGQKIYGPQGIGLVVGVGSILSKIQQGTKPTALLAGFTQALYDVETHRTKFVLHIESLRNFLLKQLMSRDIAYEIHGEGSSHVMSISFPGIKHDSEYLVSYFSEHDIYLSSRSACLGSKHKQSYVLDALNVDSFNTLRISFGRNTKKSDIKMLARHLVQLQK